jgi:hypothetical protein
MVTRLVPTTTDPERAVRLSFRAATTFSAASPCPDPGATVSHCASGAAVQVQSRPTVTVSVRRLPPLGTLDGGGDRTVWHR